MNSRLLIPASILLGSIILAIGLYLGLSQRPIVLDRELPSQPSSELATLGPAVEPTAPTPTTPSPKVYEIAGKQIELAINRAKTDLFVPKCWKPIVEAQPEPATSHYTINLTFNADGVEIARGISEIRDTDSRPDVANCLRMLPIGLTIPPPHTPVAMTLALDFP